VDHSLRAFKKLDFVKEIVGSDHNPKHQKEALELSLVDKIVDINEVKKYDVIFLAIPVDGIIAALQNLVGVKENTTIIDLGSTKAKIIASVPHQIRKNFCRCTPDDGN